MGAEQPKINKNGEAFDKLKKKLCEAPILTHPDFSQAFIIYTDVSIKGLGAILSQIQNGKEVVIAYASQTLSTTEQNYGTKLIIMHLSG